MSAGRLACAITLAAAASAGAADTPPPALVEAKVQVRSAAGGLEAAVREAVSAAPEVAWIGYAVPVDGPHSMCCWESVDSISRTKQPGCRLESRKGTFNVSGSKPADLEADATFVVLTRIAARSYDRIRVVSWSCGIDAGGRDVVWLTGVRPADSARWLKGLASGGSRQDVREGALMALALHAEPTALDALIAAARRDPDEGVRSHALFWLSQKAGRRATEAIADAVRDDPESEVRERAVFALSQLPHDEGVPRLITLARTHRDPNVREKAMFWLGQTGDARALAFFEEILKR